MIHALRSLHSVTPHTYPKLAQLPENTFAVRAFLHTSVPLKLNHFTDVKMIEVNTSPEVAFSVIQTIGGKRGWFYGNSLWKIRGFVDKLFGGVGMRGRKHPVEVEKGSYIDFWIVDEYKPPFLLKLKGQMKVPGVSLLEFKVEKTFKGCQITQTATFLPSNKWGLLYWYTLVPSHYFIFNGMINGIKNAIFQQKN